MPSVLDVFDRPLRSLRLSVTDRCNLRCTYCMPEKDYVWLPRQHLLDFDELVAVAAVFAGLGVDRLRLTGGEPLLRTDLPVLVGRLTKVSGIRDLALTTNGVLLAPLAAGLAQAGLERVTVSLDSLRPERFRGLAGRDSLAAVLAGIAAAAAVGLTRIKINTVVMRGRNDDEVLDLLDYAAGVGAEVRFIEYMDVGGATQWSWADVVPQAEILARIAAARGRVEPLGDRGRAPAARFRLGDGTTFGVIASTTVPFCGDCDRGRVTADGMFYACLYAKQGLDLRALVRARTPPDQLAAAVRAFWQARNDRGAEARLQLHQRLPLAATAELRADPHLEMHTRGG